MSHKAILNDLEKANNIYEEILRTSNKFLRNAKNFNIEVLKTHDPSYAELAQIMHKLAQIIHVLADDIEPMLAQKAFDYANIMEKMALAIKNNNEVELSQQLAILEKKPGV